ncbi:MAG TPA: hypothetical protein VFR09_05700 [Alphaproteobacteria bacterium]|nr:hypothetical protein [Alphaproteobacteria bacterium]
MPDIEERIKVIEDRNQRVAADKAWEVSWVRRGLIAGTTYLCGFILLNILGHDGAWKHAFVPVMGYLISTLSLPPLKAMWIRKHHHV